MGKVVRCPECAKVYRNLDDLEDLRDNDSICLVCNAVLEVSDWDRILASYEEDPDEVDEDADDDDIDDDEDWDVDAEEEPDFDEDLDEELDESELEDDEDLDDEEERG